MKVCSYARLKRTTVSLPDDLAAAANREARRQGISVSQLTREALEVRLRLDPESKKRRLAFTGIGASGHRTTARDHEEILGQDFAVDRDR